MSQAANEDYGYEILKSEKILRTLKWMSSVYREHPYCEVGFSIVIHGGSIVRIKTFNEILEKVDPHNE